MSYDSREFLRNSIHFFFFFFFTAVELWGKLWGFSGKSIKWLLYGSASKEQVTLMRDSVQPMLVYIRTTCCFKPTLDPQPYHGHLAPSSTNMDLNGQLQSPGPGNVLCFIVPMYPTQESSVYHGHIRLDETGGPSDLISLIPFRGWPLNCLTIPAQPSALSLVN